MNRRTVKRIENLENMVRHLSERITALEKKDQGEDEPTDRRRAFSTARNIYLAKQNSKEAKKNEKARI